MSAQKALGSLAADDWHASTAYAFTNAFVGTFRKCKMAGDRPFWWDKWVALHSKDGLAGVVAPLRGQLDAVREIPDDTAKAEVTHIFARAVAAEHAFFDAAWVGFPVMR